MRIFKSTTALASEPEEEDDDEGGEEANSWLVHNGSNRMRAWVAPTSPTTSSKSGAMVVEQGGTGNEMGDEFCDETNTENVGTMMRKHANTKAVHENSRQAACGRANTVISCTKKEF
jgi:hypothetical protein